MSKFMEKLAAKQDLQVKQLQIKCDCSHSLRLHYTETDDYGSWVSGCNQCDCTKFASDELLGV